MVEKYFYWMQGSQRLVILVAEDGEDDALLLKRAFSKVGIGLPAYVCEDGEQVISYLKGEGEFSDRAKYPFPRVLITDLKMPKCTGFDVLRWLQSHPECNMIPKVVLSASAEPEDVKLAYQLGANCYFHKPTSFGDLVKMVEIAHRFWTSAVLPELPKNC
jgi:CheY-like chemotaxis protein